MIPTIFYMFRQDADHVALHIYILTAATVAVIT